MAGPVVPLELISHSRKVCSLYKRALRNVESWFDRRDVFRYQATLMRARFDQNAGEKDIRVAKQMLLDGEDELFKTQHYQPKRFPLAPGGTSYEREVQPPDWVLDYWHPIEKAMYPKYFERRELRKQQYIEWYDKKYPDAKKQKSSH